MSTTTDQKYQNKPGDISIFTNDKKTSNTHPLLTGNVLININELKQHADPEGNVKLFISLWGKESANGKTFWSGKANPPKPISNSSDALPGTSNAAKLTPEDERFLAEQANETPNID